MIEKTVHYKLRKKNKQWVAVGITVISGVLFVTTTNSQSAHAAEASQIQVSQVSDPSQGGTGSESNAGISIDSSTVTPTSNQSPTVTSEPVPATTTAPVDQASVPTNQNLTETGVATASSTNISVQPVTQSEVVSQEPVNVPVPATMPSTPVQTQVEASQVVPAETVTPPAPVTTESAVSVQTETQVAPVQPAVPVTSTVEPAPTASTAQATTSVTDQTPTSTSPATPASQTPVLNENSATTNKVQPSTNVTGTQISPDSNVNQATTAVTDDSTEIPQVAPQQNISTIQTEPTTIADSVKATPVTSQPVAVTTEPTSSAPTHNDSLTSNSQTPSTTDDQTTISTPTAPISQVAATNEVQSSSVSTPAAKVETAEAAPNESEVVQNAVQPAMGQKVAGTMNLSTKFLAANPQITNDVAGSDQFSVSSVDPLQWTYQHIPLSQVSGAQVWQGEAYAASIPMDAKGVDSQTGQYYLDYWMPDYGFQIFLWGSAYSDKYATINDFRANFTKTELAQLEKLVSSDKKQETKNSQGQYTLNLYYHGLMAMRTLQGLQYATNLKELSIIPNGNVSNDVFGTSVQNSNLWDISPLANLNKLQSVKIPMASINDVQSLANKPDLTTLNLSYNQISDLSPLQTNRNPNLDLKKGFNHQHLLLQPITLKEGTTTFTTPSFIVKDLTASNLPVKPFNPKEDYGYIAPYPSNSDGGNIDPITIDWSNILNPVDHGVTDRYGTFTVSWKDPNSDFYGWFIQPYQFKKGIGNVVVHYQLLQANGKQITLAPDSILSGDEQTDFDLLNNRDTYTTLVKFQDGYKLYGILDGTGQVSDYQAKNGLADPVKETGIYQSDAQTYTIVLVKDWNVNVKYGVIDPNVTTTDTLPQHTAVVENGVPVADNELKGNFLSNIIKLTDNVKDFPDLTFKEAWVSNDDQNWTKLADETTEIPFIDSNQTVYVLYTKAGTAQIKIIDKTDNNKELSIITNATDPSLKGEAGKQGTFDKDAAIKEYVAKGYQFDSDDLAKGITFSTDAAKPNEYTIYLTHQTQESTVQNNYVVNFSGVGDQTPPAATKTLTWTTKKDLVSGQTMYTPKETSVTFQVPTIPGYTPDKTQVVFTAVEMNAQPANEETTVTYTKEQPVIQTGTVTYHYQDGSGKELLKSYTFSGNVGDPYPDRAVEIKGYHLQSVSGDRTGVITQTPITVTYIYDQIAQLDESTNTVIVHYHDEQGNILESDEVITGKVGEAYATDTKAFNGYRLKDIIGAPSGQIADQSTEVTYVYTQIPRPDESTNTVTVHYHDDHGNTLHSDEVITGKVGDNYTTDTKTIKGYQLKTILGTPSGQIKDQPLEVTYIYQAEQPTKNEGKVIIHHHDQNGKTILPDETITGKVGEQYAIKDQPIAGYVMKQVAGAMTGNLTKEPIEITFSYEKVSAGQPGASETVKENPVTPEQPATTDEVVQPNEVLVEQPTTMPHGITEVAKTPMETTSATAKAMDQPIQEAEPVVAAQPTAVQVSATPVAAGPIAQKADQILTGKQAEAQLAAEQMYPQTGEKTNHFAVIGLALLSFVGVVGFSRRKKHS